MTRSVVRVLFGGFCLGLFFCSHHTFLWITTDQDGLLKWVWGFSSLLNYCYILLGSVLVCLLMWVASIGLVVHFLEIPSHQAVSETSKPYLSFSFLLMVLFQWLPIPGLNGVFLIWGRDLKWYWLWMVLILFGIVFLKSLRSSFGSVGGLSQGTWKSREPDLEKTAAPLFRKDSRGEGESGILSRFLNYKYEIGIFLLCLLLFLGSGFLQYRFKRQGPMSYQLLTGDEPQYLLITHSLVADRDVDLFNNIFLREAINFFSPETMIGGHGQWGPNHRWYSKHRLGLPLLISPAYYLGYRFDLGIRNSVLLWLSILGALLAVEMFLASRDITGRKGLSLFITLPVIFSIPFFIYPSKVFPELPAALFVFMAFRRSLSPSLSRTSAFKVGLLVGFIPWFHERFILVFLVLSLFFLFKERKHTKVCLTFLIPVFVSILLQMLYYYQVNGVPYPLTTTHLGYFNPQGILNGLLGIWMDQAHGILPYAPLFVFSFWGFFYLWRQSRLQAFWLLMVVVSIYAVAGGYREWWGGFCPPGRYLVTLVPLLILPLAWWMRKGPELIGRCLFLFTLPWSVVGSWMAYFNPTSWYKHKSLFSEDFFLPILNLFIPSFLPIENSNLPHDYFKAWIWIVLILLGGAALIRTNKRFQANHIAQIRTCFAVPIIMLFVTTCFYIIYPVSIKDQVIQNGRARTMALISWAQVKPVYSIQEGLVFQPGFPNLDLHFILKGADFAHGNFRRVKSPAGSQGDIVFIKGDDTGGSPSIWGQYISLPPGDYKASFRIMASSAGEDRVATLEVTREAGKVIERRVVSGDQFNSADTFEDITIPFHLSRKSRQMEFRIWVHPGALLWVDRIKVEPVFMPGKAL